MVPDRRCRVVICDDAPDFLQILRILLEVDGVEVVGEAADGQEAIDMCSSLRPDVLTLDIAMPVMDGLTAIPLVLAASPRTRIVMLTAFEEQGIRDRAFQGGAHAYVEKGADPLSISRIVLEQYREQVSQTSN